MLVVIILLWAETLDMVGMEVDWGSPRVGFVVFITVLVEISALIKPDR